MIKELKGNIKTIVLCIVVILLFIISIFVFEPKTYAVKNQKNDITLYEKPRLEDDFYSYVNYEELSKLNIDDNKIRETYNHYFETDKLIKKEKKELINKLLENCSTYSKNSTYDKLCKYNDLFRNTNYADNKKEMDEQISRIKSVSTIKDYLKLIFELNDKYDAKILFSFDIDMLKENNKEYLNTISSIPFIVEEDSESPYYGYAYNVLHNYGIKADEIERILNNASKINEDLTKYTKSLVREKQDIYTIDELKAKYKNIDFDLINNELLLEGKRIELIDEPQVRELDKYLNDKNLDTLKDYAIVALICSKDILLDEKNYEANYNLEKELGTTNDEFSKEDLINEELYKYFGDTISYEYSKTFMSADEKDFFKDIIVEYMNTYRKRILSEEWLQDITKANALNKLNNMRFEVAYIDLKDSKENSYNLNGDSQLVIYGNMSKTYNEILTKSFIDGTYFVIGNDWLEVNAFYIPLDNAFVIEQGILKSYSENLGITKDNYKDKYYEILGVIGFTIGHEMGHAFDNNGAKYDEIGREINWWTNKDKLEYSKRTYYVDKLYENYHQLGHETLGENVADLAGMSITLQIAESHDATTADYKKIFEYYAKDFMSQSSPFYKAYLLFNDEHSPDKNRVNVVLGNMDKFYEVYNIKETDGMYISPDKRVKVW